MKITVKTANRAKHIVNMLFPENPPANAQAIVHAQLELFLHEAVNKMNDTGLVPGHLIVTEGE